MLKLLLDNQATVFKAMVGGKSRIGGNDGSPTGMSTVQVCDIPYVGVCFLMGMHLPISSFDLSVLCPERIQTISRSIKLHIICW